MEIFRDPRRIFITCNKRLTPFLKEETEALGLTVDRVFPTGIGLKGTYLDCIRLNLHLRCASQVLFALKNFRADNPNDVYRAVHAMPWEEIVHNDGYFSVTSTVDHPTVNNALFVNVKVKDAIVDRIRKDTGTRPDTGSSADKLVIHLFWREEEATVFLDTSGATLAKHGYRRIPGKAPMLEALASATLMATRWDRRSPFVNPMCGSGTVAIEAALLATRRKPGLFRGNYSFMHVRGYEHRWYDDEFEKLRADIIEVPGLRIVATDINDDAVHIAKVNASAAGVEAMIEFSVCDFADTTVPPGGGAVYFNPEYGERLGEASALEHTYSRVGDFMKKKCLGYTGYVFTGNLELAKKVGLKASRRIEFYTAKLDCRLLEYEMYQGSRRPPLLKD